MEDIKDIVAQNIVKHRKKLGLTQAELAEKINFSDKSISKWERGEGLPDLETMLQLAKLFDTTMDSLTKENHAENEIKRRKKISDISRKYVTILSTGLVWLVVTMIFVALEVFGFTTSAWLCFVYALPASAIVLIVFSSIWGKYWHMALVVSILVWTLTLAVFLTFNFSGSWLLFIICVPLQVLVILWYIFRSHKRGEKIKNS